MNPRQLSSRSKIFRRRLILAGSLLAAAGGGGAARAAALDPLAYTSLGTFNDTTANGTFTANGTAAPTLVVGSTTYTGVYQSQGTGLPVIAVFDFSSVNLAGGFTLMGTTSVPVAILSQGSTTISGTIDADGFGGGAGGAASTSFSSPGGNGSGPGAGTGGYAYGPYGGGGGGYGGVGGNAGVSLSGQGVGGPAYGNLATSLQAGSGGGGGVPFGGAPAGSGGAGGGALELGAVNSLTLAASGSISASGVAGGSSTSSGSGGGGSGGGLFLHAGSLSLGGSLAAAGAAGGVDGNVSDTSGPGGGGRVLLALPSFVVGTTALPTTINVASGTYPGYGTPGAAGVVGLAADVTTVPAGQTLSVTGGTLAGTAFNFSSSLINVQSGGTFANGGGYTNPLGAEISLGAVDARLTGGTITNNGLIDGSAGRIEAVVANAGSGEIRATAGSDLVFTAAGSTNVGSVNLFGGTVEFRAGLNNNTGTITGHGTLDVGGAGLANTGIVAFSQSSDVNGAVVNNSGGQLTTTGGATVTYYGSVTNNSGATIKTAVNSTTVFLGAVRSSGSFTGAGTVDFEGATTLSGSGGTGNAVEFASPALRLNANVAGAPAAATSFGGNVIFGSGASLTLGLGGATPGTYDQLTVAGRLTLGGALVVNLANGFSPQAGNQFDLFTAGTQTGTFSSVSLPALSNGLTWDTSQLYTSGIITAAIPEPSTWAAALLGGSLCVWIASRRRRVARGR